MKSAWQANSIESNAKELLLNLQNTSTWGNMLQMCLYEQLSIDV